MVTTLRVSPKILVVDDEPDAVDLIAFNLKEAGYDVVTADNGSEALKKSRMFAPDLLVLDLMIPEVDGLEVCKLLRRDPATSALPIIMVTAKSAEMDRVVGLEVGADDYLTKPFSPRELIIRIKNLLKRRENATPRPERFEIGDLVIDVSRHLVVVNRQPVHLTATEFKLLRTLVERRGRVMTREQLLQDVWDYDNLIDTRTVDTHIRRLREKLGRAARFLDTVRGVGYRFVES